MYSPLSTVYNGVLLADRSLAVVIPEHVNYFQARLKDTRVAFHTMQ